MRKVTDRAVTWWLLVCIGLVAPPTVSAGESREDPRMMKAAVVEAFICEGYRCQPVHVVGPWLTEQYGSEQSPYEVTTKLTLRACNALLVKNFPALQGKVIEQYPGSRVLKMYCRAYNEITA